MKADAKLRVFWTMTSVLVLESIVFSLALAPAALFWQWHFGMELSHPWARISLLGLTFIPAYLLFAFSLMVASALVMRFVGWRTPANAEMPIREWGWPLLNWVRYSISTHAVSLFAGPVFRTSPVWTFYMRLNGARLGRSVFVNSLAVTDHNLLEFGENTVIGGGVHLSGHTVENGIVKTAPVRLGRDVTVGVGAVVEIGVEAGAGCQIGALALVPKFSKLEAGGLYVGIPVRRVDQLPREE